VKNVIGENMIPGGAHLAAVNGMGALDCFLLMFPPKQLASMDDLTNHELAKLEMNATNTSELLKFFGVLILMTTYEFTSRESLWSSTAPMKYLPAPHLGLTGMSKHWFEDLFRAVRWSKQPSE
jgi:Transposase IS4